MAGVTVHRLRLAGSDPSFAARSVEGEDYGGPRGVGPLMDLAFRLYVRRFGALALLSIGVGLPLHLVFLSLPRDLTAFAPLIVLGALQLMFQFVLQGLVCRVVGPGLLGPDFRAPVLSVGLLANVVALALLSVLAFAAGLPCCFVGGFLMLFPLAVAPCVVVLEGRGFLRAAQRSFDLVWGWGSLGRWAIWMTVTWIVASPLQLYRVALKDPHVEDAVRELLPLLGDGVPLLLAAVLSLLSGIGQALMATAATVYYVDQRCRVEGWDLERRLGAEAVR